jgi:hypothetical protein
MDTHRLKVKIGSHEFEAEGSQEAVEKQFDTFKDMVRSVGDRSSPQPAQRGGGPGKPSEPHNSADIDLKLETIIKVEGEKVSLTALPTGQDGEGEAVLLILLGHKMLRASEQVTAIQLVAGMTQSGFQIERVDRIVKQLPDGQVARTGAKKGVKYRLTNTGTTQAKQIARTLIATLT